MAKAGDDWEPKTKAEREMHPSVRKIPKRRRGQLALEKVLDHDWPVSQAARHYGVDRTHLQKKVTAKKAELEAEAEPTRPGTGYDIGDRLPMVSGEKNRVGEFWEWEENYFGHLECPDCDRRHEAPEFHRHMIEAVEDKANKRILINTPPYHSKSTLITVKHTLYEICRNPDLRTCIVSSRQKLARDFLAQIGAFLQFPEIYEGAKRNLVHDFGPFRHDGATWNRDALVVGRESTEKDATVSAYGIFQDVYGARFDRIKFDDIAVEENQRNPEQVIRMQNNVDKMFLSRLGKSGQAIFIGTRVMGGDIYFVYSSRKGYVVVRYSAIQDEEAGLVLWPDHFPMSQIQTHRDEMDPASFELIYQNVESGGVNMTFTQEMIEGAKDFTRMRGQWDPDWRLIAGLDPAGGGPNSGYTAFVLIGVDLKTGVRYLIDIENHKSLKAPDLKRIMLDWSSRYRIDEWRVESNGVQSQLVLYNDEITTPLAARGVKVTPHYTHSNKADSFFGVETMGPLFHQGLMNIPAGDEPTRAAFRPLEEQLLSWGYSDIFDTVMATWFADLGVRDLLNNMSMPMFDMNMRVPRRIAKRRGIVDLGERRFTGIPLEQQRRGAVIGGRQVLGRPMEHSKVIETPPAEKPQLVNVEGTA